MVITITVTKGEDIKIVTIADDKIIDFEKGIDKIIEDIDNETIVDKLKSIVEKNIFAYYATGKTELEEEIDDDILS